MKNEHDSPENVEQKLQKFFQKKADELKAPSDLWAKLEPHLEEPKKSASSKKRTNGIYTWLAGPRLAGMATSLAVVLLLLVTGIVWWTGDNGNGTTQTYQSAADDTGHDNATRILAMIDEETIPEPAPTVPSINKDGITFSPSSGIAGTSVTVSGGGSVPGSYYSYSDDTDISNSTSELSGALDTAQRQVISTATISLEVEIVDTTISQIRGIAENLGGFLEQMSSYGSEETKQATVTIRIPQEQFFTALDRLQALGEVQSQNVGSQDVSEQFIDLEARLKSAQQEEQSLLSLLTKTQTVAEIITLEKELSQVRSRIESIQGQLNYLERRVDLATINISLSTPAKVVGQPPSGSMTIEVNNVGATVDSIKGLVSSVNGEMGQVNISVNDEKETASLSFKLYRTDFDRIITSIEKQGKTQQKYIQEGISPEDEQAEPAENPDANVYLTLVESDSEGFWTSDNIKIISITGGVLLIALLGFLLIAHRAGLLRKRTE